MKINNTKTFVCGDIHGAYKALLQCLERSNFDYNKDTLIQLGDIVDGWNEVYECVEELIKIKNLISIKGNHDDWFLDWIKYDIHPTSWLQGGLGTLQSYCKQLDKEYINKSKAGYISNLISTDLPIEHINFFNNQSYYYKDDKNNLFVHGGFNRHHTLEENKATYPEQFWWDRDLWMSSLSHKQINNKFKIKEDLNEIFIGHTTTDNWGTDKPMNSNNIWNLDTGAGFKGKLTFMDIDTKEIFQSDLVSDLYPDQKGRN
jgi:serine/threonine protein phosphatase 1